MADGQKIPFNQAVSRNSQRNAEDRSALDGKQLPCSVTAVDATVGGAIVEAQAEVSSGFTIPKIKIPHVGGEWIRYPVQIGEKGFFISADASLNETSGLGAGKSDLTQPANLTPLAFMPVGNVNWTPTPDTNKTVIYGNDGVIIMDKITGSVMMTIDASGVHFNCPVYCNGHRIDETHTHGGVQTGGGTTGQVS